MSMSSEFQPSRTAFESIWIHVLCYFYILIYCLLGQEKQSNYVKMPVIPKLVSAIFLKVYIALTFWMPHFRPTTVVHIMKTVLLSKWIPPYLMKYGVQSKHSVYFTASDTASL